MGNTDNITLKNKTNEVIEIIDHYRIIPRKTVEAGRWTNIKPKEYDGDDSGGGLIPLLMIVCGGRLLRSTEGDYLISGKKFFSTGFKTITIDQPNNQNYEVKFEQRGDSGTNNPPLKFLRDTVFDRDYGWSVQFINGSVKLTRDEEGVTMILDPSKLFSRIKDQKITTLLHMVLQFWPRTFADLNRKDDLRKTIDLVNDLMVQAREYNTKGLKGEVAKVIDKLVSDLNTLCAAKVEWYRPLFPGMEKKFLPVAEPVDQLDQQKLQNFTTTIAPLLRQ